MFIAQAVCGVTSCLVLHLQPAEVSRTVTSSFGWSWTISVNVNEETHNHGSRTQYSSFVSALFTVMHNKLQYTWRGDYCERVHPAQLPVLTWRSSSVPPGTTSTIRSPPGPRRLQQMCHDSKLLISWTIKEISDEFIDKAKIFQSGRRAFQRRTI
jgi:hypothetical protein